MSENVWQKRTTMKLPCPSGMVCEVRRPSPEASLKGGRLVHIFSSGANAQQADLSDEEAAKVYLFARQLILASVVSPVLVSDESAEGLTPEDIPPADFWFVFTWAMRGGRGIPVATREGETTVEAVETFPDESGALHIPGGDGEQVSQMPV